MEKFEVTSNYINVTDPYYSKEDNKELFNIFAKNGIWLVKISYDNYYDIDSMKVFHREFNIANTNSYTKVDKQITVDSSNVGVFDSLFYKAPEGNDETNPKSHYGKCISLTSRECGYGILSHGAVCIMPVSYGDNILSVSFFINENKEVMAIYILKSS